MEDAAGAEEGQERAPLLDCCAKTNEREEPRPQGSQADLPTEPLEMSEVAAAAAAAAERAARQEALVEPARKKLREAVFGRVSKGTRNIYRPYQALWEVSHAPGTFCAASCQRKMLAQDLLGWLKTRGRMRLPTSCVVHHSGKTT